MLEHVFVERRMHVDPIRYQIGVLIVYVSVVYLHCVQQEPDTLPA